MSFVATLHNVINWKKTEKSQLFPCPPPPPVPYCYLPCGETASLQGGEGGGLRQSQERHGQVGGPGAGQPQGRDAGLHAHGEQSEQAARLFGYSLFSFTFQLKKYFE